MDEFAVCVLIWRLVRDRRAILGQRARLVSRFVSACQAVTGPAGGGGGPQQRYAVAFD
jgi:hypothetical protein